MGRISRASSMSLPESKASQVLLEVNSALGRQSMMFDIAYAHEVNNQKRLKIFLEKNGYGLVDINNFVKLVKSYLKANYHGERECVRIEYLGLEPDRILNLPCLGQSHELEFAKIRAKLRHENTIDHAEDLFESSNKFNGVCAFKIVSETLGKTKAHATSEIILGPAATKSQYQNSLVAVDELRKLIHAPTQSEAQNLGGIIANINLGTQPIIPKNNIDALVWNLDPDNTRRPCVHTSRGAPIRAISMALQDDESGLFKAPRKILELCSSRTDEFIIAKQLWAPRGAKLWETINLSMWMAACEGVVQPLLQDNLDETYANNRLVRSWTLYAGKNFFGTLPRFSAGDLLRTGGLKAHDEKQLHDLFASEDLDFNKKNLRDLAAITCAAIKDFLSYLDTIQDSDAREIIDILKNRWPQVESWVYRDLKSDFIPRANKKRYPEDMLGHYGARVNTKASSPSFASSQFLPRRERLSSALLSKAPVSGAFEFRSASFAGNTEMSEYFSTTNLKRKQQALDNSWANFETYAAHFAKKRRA